MPPDTRPGRGRVLAAVTISVCVHTLLAGGFLARGTVPVAPVDWETRVAGPDTPEVVFNLLDVPVKLPDVPRPDKAVARVEPVPAVLPAAVVAPPPSPAPTGVVQSGHSSPGSDPLPEPGGAAPLHGRLKHGKSVVYVLDRSASMGPDGLLRQAVAAVKASLSQLPADGRFQIVAYNGGTTSLNAQPLPATPENLRRAAAWLERLRPEGSSDHRAGLREALWARPDAVFLLTDADDLDEREVRTVRPLLRDPVYLTVVLMGRSPRPAMPTPLERLVQEKGGEMRSINR